MIKWLCGWPHSVVCVPGVEGAGGPEGLRIEAPHQGRLWRGVCAVGKVALGRGRVWDHLMS